MSSAADVATLEVQDLTVAIDGVGEIVHAATLHIQAGEVLALVGESGSGKTIMALALMGLLPPLAHVTAGSVVMAGQDLLQLAPATRRQYMGKRIAMIFQEPMSALNPVKRIGDQITEAIHCHERVAQRAARARALELLARVRMPEPVRVFAAWPHELSGGMRQRVLIAMALVCGPELLIADEPTTALDATVQSQILLLLDELRTSMAMSVLLITHDLGVVAALAARVAVMYAGHLVETGAVDEVLAHPAHPYTRGLLDCIPQPGEFRASLPAIPGRLPLAGQHTSGCEFAARCKFAREQCATQQPHLTSVAVGRLSRCLFATEVLQQQGTVERVV